MRSVLGFSLCITQLFNNLIHYHSKLEAMPPAAFFLCFPFSKLRVAFALLLEKKIMQTGLNCVLSYISCKGVGGPLPH